MLSWFDDFTVKLLRHGVRQFKAVTGTKVENNHLIFSLEKFGEELRIITDADGVYLFLYSVNDTVTSQRLSVSTLTIRNLHRVLGLLFY